MASTCPIPTPIVAAAPRPRVQALGISFDSTDVAETAALIAQLPSKRENSARIYVTPNIQHVAEMRRNPELRRAIHEADLLTCDGFPLVSYARLSGCRLPGRITGREVAERLMLHTPLATDHVLFFLVDSAETANAVKEWARHRELAGRVLVEVAPPRFGEDRVACAALAQRIREARTTILFLGLGAPKCELFASRFRGQLGGCWALCIGQSVRVALGLVNAPPELWVKLRMEWAWRIIKEPRRLSRRYASASLGFAAAVLSDVLSSERARLTTPAVPTRS